MAYTAKPFFSIVTRVFKRPDGVRRSTDSVIMQTFKDWEHVFLVDRVGKHLGGNVLWANKQFDVHSNKLSGNYILALDDDGEFARRDFLAAVYKTAIREDMPECILVHSISPNKTGSHHILPRQDVWDVNWEMGERPCFWYGHGYNWCVRRDIFCAMAHAYAEKRGGDWHFMTALIRTGVTFVRCNIVGGHSLSRGHGRVFEEQASNGWFYHFRKEYGLEKVAKNVWRLLGGAKA